MREFAKKRWQNTTKAERSASGTKAANARWAKSRKAQPRETATESDPSENP
jgi:hypothetical protein